MSRTDTKFFVELRGRIVISAGFHITTKKDCRVLSEMIRANTGSILSEATLYRFFLLKGGNHKFYQSTLSIMARFVGFNSWDNFCKESLQNQDALGTSSMQVNGFENPTILDKVIAYEAWDIADAYFKDISNIERPEAMHELAWNIFNSLKKNPDKERTFYERFAAHPTVRASFFELASDPDSELPNYMYGIELYLEESSRIGTKHRLRDLVYGHSLLVRKAFIDKDFSRLIWRFEKHLFPELFEEALSSLTTAIPLARLFEAKWLYLCCLGDRDALKQHQKNWFRWVDVNQYKWELVEKKAVIYCASEAVFLTNDKTDFYPRMLQHLRGTVSILFGESAKPTIKELLYRTEFNGVRLQKRLRNH
jgi:hypothetical protein